MINIITWTDNMDFILVEHPDKKQEWVSFETAFFNTWLEQVIE